LDCQDVVRLDRLRMRGALGATQEMLSWAAWQRVHAVDPQWRQDVICGAQLDEMRWERWTSWQRGNASKQLAPPSLASIKSSNTSLLGCAQSGRPDVRTQLEVSSELSSVPIHNLSASVEIGRGTPCGGRVRTADCLRFLRVWAGD